MTETSTLNYPCLVPDCTRVFDSPQALSGHAMAHRVPDPCPECGEQYKTMGSLGNHRKNAHGVEGSSWASKAKRESRPVGRPKKSRTEEFRADDIVNAAIALLWPSGMLPVQVMYPLIQWRDATIEFLEKINSE